MPRTPVNTIYTPRVQPTTTYTTPRDWWTTFTCDTTSFTCDTTSFTCDKVSTWWIAITSVYTRPRKLAILEVENWDFFELENWELLLAEWGLTSNIIQTIYT